MFRTHMFAALLLVGVASAPAYAQKKCDTGASDTEIKLGNTMAYSGPASAYGLPGKVDAAYFAMVHDKGGINAAR